MAKGKHESGGGKHRATEPTAAQKAAARESGARAERAVAGGRAGKAAAKAQEITKDKGK